MSSSSSSAPATSGGSLDEDVPSMRSISIYALGNHLERNRAVGTTTTGTSPALPHHRQHHEYHVYGKEPTPAEEEATSTSSSSSSMIQCLQPRTVPACMMLCHSVLAIPTAAASQAEQVSLHEMLHRMEGFLLAKAIAYAVDIEQALIECSTSCCLRFVIYLWQRPAQQQETSRNNENSTRPSSTILVELQRRYGCAILMQQIRKQLFDCLLTGHVPDTPEIRRCPTNKTLSVSTHIKQLYQRMTSSSTTNNNNPCHAHGRVYASDERDENMVGLIHVEQAMDTCDQYLGSERYDLKQLAMESLVDLTDTRTTALATALCVAQRILQVPPSPPEQRHEPHPPPSTNTGSSATTATTSSTSLHHQFVHTLRCCSRVCRRRRQSVVRKQQREQQSWEEGVEDYLAKNTPGDETMTLRTLTVLWNALQLLYRCQNHALASETTPEIVIDSSVWSSPSWQSITSSLHSLLDGSGAGDATITTNPCHNPQTVALAADCLRVVEELQRDSEKGGLAN